MIRPFQQKIRIEALGQKMGTGWLSPLPDLRDYTAATASIRELSAKLKLPKPGDSASSLAKVDLRQWCSPIESQGEIGSCTAQALVGLVEYFEKRAFGKYIDGSRLFVYKTTRNLMQTPGDTGAYLRNAMGALVLCGVPPETYWPYTDADPEFDQEPPAFVYSVAKKYEAIQYFCHDPQTQNTSGQAALDSVKTYLSAGIPSMFGFYGFSSFEQSDQPGHVPYPTEQETAEWGHAVVAVGFDDKMKIKNNANQKTTTGALLIRNSWGQSWGEQGYGWLPYAYVQNRLALDFWSLLSMEWVDTKQFGI